MPKPSSTRSAAGPARHNAKSKAGQLVAPTSPSRPPLVLPKKRKDTVSEVEAFSQDSPTFERTSGNLAASGPETIPVERWMLDRLREHPLHDQHFPDLAEAEMQELCDSLDTYGQREPLDILPNGFVLSGRHRLRAARQLGWPALQVRVRHELASAADEQVEAFVIDANFSRRQLSRLSLARLFLRRRDLEARGAARRGQGELRDEFAERFGKSGRQLDRYLKVAQQPREVQDAVENGLLSLNDALLIERLSAPRRQKLLQVIAEGAADRKELRKLLSSNSMSKRRPKSLGPFAELMQAGTAFLEHVEQFGQDLTEDERKRFRTMLRSLVKLEASSRSG
ncbi:ParB/RepB/Spo0J family partition protein [Anatilimnocola sp. NA78]|uniref:ParB/RepB/Spo0J family partition protein n=1 Tax=Anatilimnocola sp. NA78 TaxID=3415683 RepID=UPI003CE53041